MQQRRPSHRPPRRRVPRKYSTSFSTIDWGFRPSIVAAIRGDNDESCDGKGGTPQTGGGGEAERSNSIVSQDSSSSDTNKKRNHLRKVFNSFKGIFAHREESSLSTRDDDKSSTDKKPNATGEEKQQQPLQQRKSSATTASSAASSAAALIRHLPSSQLDESEISVDDEGFLHWDRTKRTFTQCPENK